jgi:hypothetical protein
MVALLGVIVSFAALPDSAAAQCCSSVPVPPVVRPASYGCAPAFSSAPVVGATITSDVLGYSIQAFETAEQLEIDTPNRCSCYKSHNGNYCAIRYQECGPFKQAVCSETDSGGCRCRCEWSNLTPVYSMGPESGIVIPTTYPVMSPQVLPQQLQLYRSRYEVKACASCAGQTVSRTAGSDISPGDAHRLACELVKTACYPIPVSRCDSALPNERCPSRSIVGPFNATYTVAGSLATETTVMARGTFVSATEVSRTPKYFEATAQVRVVFPPRSTSYLEVTPSYTEPCSYLKVPSLYVLNVHSHGPYYNCGLHSTLRLAPNTPGDILNSLNARPVFSD